MGLSALCFPSSHACDLVGTEQLSSVLASQLAWKKGKKEVVFIMAFDYSHSLSISVVNAVAALSLPVCNCSFLTLELHAECRFVAWGRTSSSFLQAFPFQILSRVPDVLPEML